MAKSVLEDLLSKQNEINEVDCEKLVKSVYNLNDLEFETYCIILIHGSSTVTNIMDYINKKAQYVNNTKDRTMISRALKQLYLKELVTRISETKNMSRGYYHIYSAKSIAEIQEAVSEYIDTWYEKAKNELSVLTERFEDKKKKELVNFT